MKRILTFLCMAAALMACQKLPNAGFDPTQGADAHYFKMTDEQVKAQAFQPETISDPGTITTPYQFFSPNTITWDDYRYNVIGLEDRFAALEIPADTLKQMTTMALVKSVANFPLLGILSTAYSGNCIRALEMYFQYSALFRELESRENVEDIMIWAFSQMDMAPVFYTEDGDAWREWQEQHWEALYDLSEMSMMAYQSLLFFYASDHFDFTRSEHLAYFKSLVAQKINRTEQLLPNRVLVNTEPLLLICEKYFDN